MEIFGSIGIASGGTYGPGDGVEPGKESTMALSTDFIPAREADLDAFVHNFNDRIAAAPTQFGISAAQSAALQALVDAWDTSYAITKSLATRCQSAVIAKNQAKVALVKNVRELARIIQAYPGTTNEMRSLLGLTVPATRQSQKVPQSTPMLEIVKVVGNVVTLQLRDSENLARLRPQYATSATLFSYIGENPPTSAEGWYFQTGTTTTRTDLTFDPSLPMGTTVYLTAFWKNDRDMSGPACQPVAVTLLGSAALPGAVRQGKDRSMSIAA